MHKFKLALQFIFIFSLVLLSAEEKKDNKKNNIQPNFVIIWGDDIGQSNLSAYTKGLTGYRTPYFELKF